MAIEERFAFGGEPPKDQRVYFFNTKEIIGNKYGTPSPVPFRVVDNNIGLDMDISIRCHGEYSYKITDPILFYTNVCGNIDGNYYRNEIDSQLKSELMTALQPAFAKISDMGIRYSSLPGHAMELADALNDVLSSKWRDLRGIEIISFGVSSVKASEEDEAMIKELQRNAALRNPNMAAAHMVGAQADAMKSAANNPNGAMMGFMGMNMAQGMGGSSAADLFAMGQRQPSQPENQNSVKDNSWKCECGADNSGKFCVECGKPKPIRTSGSWRCECGADNTGKFCSECGNPKPVRAVYKCDKCGWTPQDPYHPPKFCPECGDRFDNNDIQ